MEKNFAEKMVNDLINPPKTATGEMILVGYQMKLYEAEFINHKFLTEYDSSVIKLYFKLKHHELEFSN
ncbi:hypothetical protein [Bacillus infantis]|uniref:hypothetical protein n=1 Tax=Bacillus infantis TaxID=324767 RepID=UPI00209ECAE0|nr:hypothetical protein [Bacillus infantis]MCP1158184.1 hypothetical protein [Bacillus infantis]